MSRKFSNLEVPKQLISRPLKSILLSDIQQYNYQTSIVNLQVFVSLGIETCRFL